MIIVEYVGGLAHVHSAVTIHVYHRDVKYDNILLDGKVTSKSFRLVLHLVWITIRRGDVPPCYINY